jgi:hypothetical protein
MMVELESPVIKLFDDPTTRGFVRETTHVKVSELNTNANINKYEEE